MPISIQPLLTVSPALPTSVLRELQSILNTVARGAFGQQADFRILLVQSASTDRADFQLEVPLGVPPGAAREIALRTADTALQLIGVLSTDLGVAIRRSENPWRRMLNLGGLTWHLVRCRLSKILSALESPTSVELTSAHTSFCLRIATGRPLGYSGPSSAYLCGEVIRRRTSSSGTVVRLRFGGKLMSVIVPREICPAAVSDGTLIRTAPVVGLIPRRLVQVERCQLSLFRDC